MKKLLFGIVCGLCLLTATGLFFRRHAISCELIPVMGYQKIDREVFVVSEQSREHSEVLVQLINSAAQRITTVYGSPISTPRILFTNDAETSLKWGANETASMHRMPWRSCIIVGPEGLNTDVISHEWLHAELQTRVGFWRFVSEIPVWFDEGAALSLDFRAPFLPDNINLSKKEIEAVKSRVGARDFYSGNVHENYQAARMAVAPLIRNKTFFENLKQVSDGESFETVFSSTTMPKQPSVGGSLHL